VYLEADQHRYLLERSLKVTSSEMQQLFDDLGASSEELARKVDELARKNAELLKLDELKTGFISTASHELRTPLTSIRAFSELLADDPCLDQTQREFALAINLESERLTRLANDLLDLSRMQAGAARARLRPVDLHAALGRLLQEQRPLADRQGVALDLFLPRKLPEVVADPDGLWQVLLNLTDNALKFTQVGFVVLSAKEVDGAVSVLVSDTGPGINEADLPHVFEPFYQVQNVLSGKPRGAGLGLAICREIVEQHGSELRVESILGEGSRFSFQLPVVDGTQPNEG
jgi:signal transduction histidine kinase